MENSISVMKTAAVFISLLIGVGSCKTQPSSSEVQPNMPMPNNITVWSSNKHTLASGIAAGCPDGPGGARIDISYTMKLSTMDAEPYVFDSLWVAEPNSSNSSVEWYSSDTITYDLNKATLRSFKLSQVQDRSSYTLTASYFPDPCRGLKIDSSNITSEANKAQLPIMPNMIASGIITYYNKKDRLKRYHVFKNMVISSFQMY